MNEQPSGLVRVLVGGATAGTGFLVSADGLIATCTHVVAGAQRDGDVAVVFRFGPPAEADVVREARVARDLTRPVDAQDIAFLRVCGPLPSGVTAMTAGSSRAALGATLRTFGFPDAKPIEAWRARSTSRARHPTVGSTSCSCAATRSRAASAAHPCGTSGARSPGW